MPKPLFAKLVAVAAIGFLCLLGGSVYGLSTGDRILLMLSILIGACSLIRFLLLLRDIRSGSYYVLFGTCVKREPSLFKKSQQITFKSDEGKEYHFTFEKSIKLLEGHRYKLYFRKKSNSTEAIDSPMPDLLGFEEIMEYATKATEGVKNAVVNFMTLKMTVEFEEGVNPKEIMQEVLKNCKKVEDDCEIFL